MSGCEGGAGISGRGKTDTEINCVEHGKLGRLGEKNAEYVSVPWSGCVKRRVILLVGVTGEID